MGPSSPSEVEEHDLHRAHALARGNDQWPQQREEPGGQDRKQREQDRRNRAARRRGVPVAAQGSDRESVRYPDLHEPEVAVIEARPPAPRFDPTAHVSSPPTLRQTSVEVLILTRSAGTPCRYRSPTYIFCCAVVRTPGEAAIKLRGSLRTDERVRDPLHQS